MAKREEIMMATIRLYHEKGDSLSMDAVAKSADCSKTLIVHYFGSRSRLIKCCFKMVCDEVTAALCSVDPPEGQDVEALKQHLTGLWKVYFNYLRDNPLKARFYIEYTHNPHRIPHRYESPEAIIMSTLSEKFQHIIEDDGHLMFDVEYMVAVANGMAAYVFSERKEANDELTDRCHNILMNGIVTVNKKQRKRFFWALFYISQCTEEIRL